MLTEKQISPLRGTGKVPEYKDIFPPKVSDFYDNELVTLIGEANRAIGNLNSYARIVPNPDLLIRPMLLREALASSIIEGTQATARDIVEHDAGIKLPFPLKGEALEVVNHREATRKGLSMLNNEGLPLSNRVIREMHNKLMRGGVRGRSIRPGEFRKGSNVVARGENVASIIYLPPPADRVEDLMKDFEKFLNLEHSDADILLRCAASHYQFEAIHPFGDGNGRIGRVLISLYLIKEHVLEYPLLYMSGYLLREKDLYYKKLLEVTTKEDWSSWLKFFLQGIQEQATRSRNILGEIYSLYTKYQEKVKKDIPNSIYAPQLVEQIFISPAMNTSQARRILGATHATTIRLLRDMKEIGLVTQRDTKRQRNITFYNDKLISLLEVA